MFRRHKLNKFYENLIYIFFYFENLSKIGKTTEKLVKNEKIFHK